MLELGHAQVGNGDEVGCGSVASCGPLGLLHAAFEVESLDDLMCGHEWLKARAALSLQLAAP